MFKRNRLILLALVGIWLGWPVHTAASTFNPWVCEDKCVSGEACNSVCWRTEFEFIQDYPSTTCGAEGYECCGDGVCTSASEGCNGCTEDCGVVSGCVYPDECYDNGDCDTGEVCNAAHECVESAHEVTGSKGTCGGPCTSNSDCCGSDVCFGDPGQKQCGIPASTYCPNAPACYGQGYSNCQQLANNTCGGSAYAKDLYCDPGIDRCMFNWGFDCPSALNMCI